MNSARPSSPRGVAMLLVLVSLATATILATAYLASRDNSAIIGANVASGTAARWSAMSGVEVVAFMLESDADWQSAHVNGRLLEDYAIAGGTVDVDLIDLETGAVPKPGADYLKVTATATFDGITQTAVAQVHVLARADEDGADIDLSDFVLFAKDDITLQDDVTVARWPKAPASDLGKMLAIGTQSGTADTIHLGGNAASIDTVAFLPPGASSSALNNLTLTDVDEIELLDVIPMPSAPDHEVAPTPPLPTSPLAITNGATLQFTSDTRVDLLDLQNGSELHLDGDLTFVVDHDATLLSDAKIKIDGDVVMVVFDDLNLDEGAIELEPDATLELYVAKDMTCARAYIGDLRSNALRDNTGEADAMDPDRVKIYTTPETTTSAWSASVNSVLKGSLYGPNANFDLGADSAVYGRVAADSVLLVSNAAMFYDHRMDTERGFVNLDGPIYEPDGHVRTSVLEVTKLDRGSDLFTIDGGGGGELGGGGGGGGNPPATYDVEYTITSVGLAVADWEN